MLIAGWVPSAGHTDIYSDALKDEDIWTRKHQSGKLKEYT